MSLTAALDDILKVNLTIQMELIHWDQDKWEAIPSKNHVQGCLWFSDNKIQK